MSHIHILIKQGSNPRPQNITLHGVSFNGHDCTRKIVFWNSAILSHFLILWWQITIDPPRIFLVKTGCETNYFHLNCVPMLSVYEPYWAPTINLAAKHYTYNYIFLKYCLIFSWYLHVWNGVAVAAYSPADPRRNFKTNEIESHSGFRAQPHLRRARHPPICH